MIECPRQPSPATGTSRMIGAQASFAALPVTDFTPAGPATRHSGPGWDVGSPEC